ncbi:hypothetical protein QN277_027692 [Acacia crassicarpa]|uniref:Uncharacterized protein n=1 Tax=Acacia crassicarpa TaxID=499986 RepID=A0AAE1JZA2_9FABA|nr:hypothetical protein QN277_027692 [Acacia crassicarpa]
MEETRKVFKVGFFKKLSRHSWRLKFYWSSLRWKRIHLPVSFMDDVVFKIVSLFKPVVFESWSSPSLFSIFTLAASADNSEFTSPTCSVYHFVLPFLFFSFCCCALFFEFPTCNLSNENM